MCLVDQFLFVQRSQMPWSSEEDMSRVVWQRFLVGPRPPPVKWPTKEKRNVSAVSSPRTTLSAGKPRPEQSCVIGSRSPGFGTSRGTCIVEESPGLHHESLGGQAVQISRRGRGRSEGQSCSLEASMRWEMPTPRHSKFSRMHWRRPVLQSV